jgi:exodeoxyribonuclease VII large subunit
MFDTFNTVLTVTDITNRIREVLEGDTELQSVWVSGEISNMTVAASGHWYFTLKDSSAQIKGVMWRSSAARQSFVPNDGDKIEARGRIAVYPARGEYQIVAERVRPLGMGDLYAQFEELKAKLAEEGLFEESRKRPIPVFPRRIGVVTSPDAAAFQDIQNVLRRRFPLGEIVLSGTQVQGVDAPPLIVRALKRLVEYGKVDVILLCRGGGSIEDLWCFNDERVARAVADCSIPVISGVGHETDFTIVDFVADLRAPTPSAAAELATPHIDALRESVYRTELEMTDLLRNTIQARREQLTTFNRTMRYASPEVRVRTLRQQIDSLHGRMLAHQRAQVALLRERVAGKTRALESADPRAILARGYAIVRRSDDNVRLKSAADARPGDGLTIQLPDGEIAARVEDKDSHGLYKRTLF